MPLSASSLPTLQSANDGYVLDIGCGRGELLALLGEAGVPARGIDVNGEMVALCRERGFDAAGLHEEAKRVGMNRPRVRDVRRPESP